MGKAAKIAKNFFSSFFLAPCLIIVGSFCLPTLVGTSLFANLAAKTLRLNSVVITEGKICLRDLGVLSGNFPQRDLDKWQSVCLQHNGNFSEKVIFDRSQVELYLLEHNIFVEKIIGDKVTFEQKPEFLSIEQIKKTIIDRLAYPDDAQIEFIDSAPLQVARLAQLSVAPLRTHVDAEQESTTEQKTLFVNHGVHSGASNRQFAFTIKTDNFFYLLKQDITRGKIIGEEDFEKIGVDKVDKVLFKNKVNLLKRNPAGGQAYRTLKKNHIFRVDDVVAASTPYNNKNNSPQNNEKSEQAIVVKAGTSLELLWQQSNLQISVNARLLRSTAVGQSAEFSLPKGKRIRATIVDEKTAQIAQLPQ